MVSIIITTKDQSNYIEPCVQSLINQEYSKDFEIIVIDDASQDNTIAHVRKFAEKVSIITKHKPLGWLNSLVKACEAAKGELLVFFDPHCVANAQWLDTIVSLFEKDKNLSILTGPAFHGNGFMQKIAALTFHAPFLPRKRKIIDYIFDDNFAIKKSTIIQLLKELPIEKNVNDGVGSTLLSSKIKQRHVPVLYEPRIEAFHISPNFYGYLSEWRYFSAETTIEIRLLDPSMRGAEWLKYKLLAAILYAMVRFMQDIFNSWRFRKELRVGFFELPALLMVVAIGKIWYCAGLITVLRKQKKKRGYSL